MVPHVFYYEDMRNSEEYPRDVTVRSICCGEDVSGCVPIKAGWSQPSPCVMGWHTTNVEAVKEQYNGFNVLHCDLDAGGKCRRVQMKHHAHYNHLYDYEVSYVEADSEDQEGYSNKKREELGDQKFEFEFGHVDVEQVMNAKKREGWGGY